MITNQHIFGLKESWVQSTKVQISILLYIEKTLFK